MSCIQTMTGRVAMLLVAATAAVSGCSGTSHCPASGAAPAADCAAGVEYQGTFYLAWSQRLPAVRGADLGDAAYPACNDTGCEQSAPDTPTSVWALRGVDPKDAVVGFREGSRRLIVYGRLNGDPSDIFRHTADGHWQLRDR